jgi:ferritin-like protein
MSDSPSYLHEAASVLSPKVLDDHRAYRSLMEELEAVDWYAQRVEATSDEQLAAVLAHNRDEEKEHAAMVLEWLRRGDPTLDRHLRTYLFTTDSILEIEERAEAGGDDSASTAERASASGDLGIGSLRERNR